MLVAIYDANVLYPGSLRDLLIRVGQTALFQAKWTDEILDEVFDAIVATQPELSGRLERTRTLMNAAIPDALVTGYEHLIDDLELPDPDDRHVLAAAIHADAEVIVTRNLKDFPDDRLKPYGVEAQNPDDFVLHVFGLAPAQVVGAVRDQARALSRPNTTPGELLDRLQAVGLPRSAAAMRQYPGI